MLFSIVLFIPRLLTGTSDKYRKRVLKLQHSLGRFRSAKKYFRTLNQPPHDYQYKIRLPLTGCRKYTRRATRAANLSTRKELNNQSSGRIFSKTGLAISLRIASAYSTKIIDYSLILSTMVSATRLIRMALIRRTGALLVRANSSSKATNRITR